jgi:hypothetical protein
MCIERKTRIVALAYFILLYTFVAVSQPVSWLNWP